MGRFTRTSAALALLIAVIALPLSTDWCAASCEAAHSAAASPSDPSCHHASTTATIGRAPIGCGHDHTGVGGTIVTNASSLLPVVKLLAAVPVPAPAFVAPVHMVVFDGSRAGPPPGALPRSISSPLRI